MASNEFNTDPFIIKDCALIAIAAGKKAQNLRELRELLNMISPDSIYYHFWGGLLRPRFDDPEYHNDFAFWAAHSLHDKILAERLSVIDPTEFSSLEYLRQELIEVLEERLDEIEYPLWSKSDNQFEFICSQIVIFNTNQTVSKPEEFAIVLPKMSVGSCFFHFIDARRRSPNTLDDFQNWLLNFGNEYEGLCQQLSEIGPYFASLTKLRDELASVFRTYFHKD